MNKGKRSPAEQKKRDIAMGVLFAVGGLGIMAGTREDAAGYAGFCHPGAIMRGDDARKNMRASAAEVLAVVLEMQVILVRDVIVR